VDHVTFLYLSTLIFTWMVVIFVARPRDTGRLSKPGGLKRGKYSSLFSTQLYPINVANLPKCCNITLTVMVALQGDVRNSRRLFLQRIIILEPISPFVLLLSHGYYLVKNIKSIRELVMVKNKKWNSRSFTLRKNFLWRRSEQSCNGTHSVIQDVCFCVSDFNF
jgi:hypothetical protein